MGFTGIWLVLALFCQGWAGLLAAALWLGRDPVRARRSRVGRDRWPGACPGSVAGWLTVSGLIATTVALGATALLLRHAGGDAAWMTAGPLLLAGLGGGMVTSPNLTLSLQNVPVAMAGAAGGALQTAQRIGGAIGTAVLATIFYRVLIGTGHDYPTAVSDALLCACGPMCLALLMAIAELIRRRYRRDEPAPTPRHEHQVSHI